jgi:FMN reductase [NAD(P)H]
VVYVDVNKDVYPNETMRLLCERASCRSFVEKKIPEDVLAAVLRAGTRCASGGNLQPYSVIKVEEPRTRQKLADLCGGQSFISRAPCRPVVLHRLEQAA